MNTDVFKRLNYLLGRFSYLKRYKKIRLPLKEWLDFKDIPFSDRGELRDFDYLNSPEPVFNITATSGSTASRLIVAHSRKAYASHLARVSKSYRACGLKNGDLCLNVCSYSLNAGARIMEEGLKRIGVGVIPFGIFDSKEKIAELISLIKKFRPNILNSYTNQLYDIFSILKRKHSIKKCIVNGEPLLLSYKDYIEGLSGARIYNYYGSMEFSGFAITQNPQDRYMRIIEDGLYIEVLKENSQTSSVGKGKIVITDLTNECMPFIRYMLGDVVEIVRRKQHKYLRVIGRAEDSIIIDGEVFNRSEIINAIMDMLLHPCFFMVIDKDKHTYKDKITLNIMHSDRRKIQEINSVVYKKFGITDLVSVREYSGKLPKTSTGKIRHLIDLRKDD